MTPEEELLWEIFSEPEDRDTPRLDALMRYDEYFSNENREVDK